MDTPNDKKGFSREQIAERNKEVIDLLRGYKNFSDMQKRDAQLEMLTRLNGLIVRDCNKYRGRGVDFEELQQEAILAIIGAIDNYDPTSFMPTTYFEYYINGALNKLCIPDGLSIYYDAQIKELKKAVAEIGMDPDNILNIPDETLASISKKSIKTVREAKDQMGYTRVSMATIGGDVTANEFNSSPESLILHEERLNVLRRAFNELDEVERLLMECIYMQEKPMSDRKLAEIINTDEMLMRLHLPKKIDTNFIKQRKNIACMKIRNFPGIEKVFVFDKEPLTTYVAIDDTEEEDIETAIKEGILRL